MPSSALNRRWYGRLWTVLVVIALATLAAGAAYVCSGETRLIASAGESLTLAAASIAKELDLLISERYGNIETLAQAVVSRRGDSAAMTDVLLSAKRFHPLYLWLAVTDEKGRIVAATNPADVGGDRSTTSWFQAVRNPDGVSLQDPRLSGDAGARWAVALTVAIRSPGGEFLGTVTARLGLEVLTEVFARNVRILQMQRDPPTRIEWQFLADDGRVLAESSRKQDDTVNLKALQLPSAILSDSTQPGYVEELDARRHVPVVTGYAQTTGIDESQRPHWRVLVRIDRSDILAPTRVLLTRLGVAEALVLLPLVVLLRWIIAQRKRTELAVLQAHDELEQRVQERTAQLLNATEALQESEARWRAISELTSDWAYAYRRQADGGLLLEWVTGAFARITGFTLEEVQARGGLRALVHPDDLAGMGERDQALPEGQPVSREIRIITKSGTVRWLLDHGLREWTDPRTGVVRFYGAAQDITERKRADEALQHSEQRYRTLIGASSDGIVVTDLDANIVMVNQEAVAMHGCERSEELVGKSALEFVTPEDWERAVDNAQQTLHLGSVSHVECTLVRKDGIRLPVELSASPITDSEGKPQAFVGVVRDLTERRRAEEALRESEARKGAILESALDCIITMDGDGRITEFNPAAEKTFGYTRAQVIGKALDETIIPPSLRERHLHSLARHLATGATSLLGKRVEITAMRADGSEFPVELAVIRIGRDGPAMFTGYLRDISDRRRVEEEVQRYCVEVGEARRRAEQQATELAQRAEELTEARNAALDAARVKSEFLANMSHEIRTPMTAILGYTDLVSDSKASRKERRSYLETIRRNGEHLQRILDDILDLSKIEAGRMTLERIECSPVQLVAEVASLMRPRALDKGLTFDVTYEGAIPKRIHVDPTRLRQILMNLVGNAIKFTECGGVRILVKMGDRMETTGPSLRFEVIDTGVGLTSVAQHKLFTPFTQADASTTRKFGGTGLGLTISKRLAEMLGGDISVRSAQGQGSTFVLTLETGPLDGVPMLEDPREAHGRPAARRPARGAKQRLRGRILLAEDAPDSQRLLSFYLRRAGAEVAVAENGKVACEMALAAAAAGTSFDVILMDMQMPELDGYGAAAQLRAEGYSRPIIALTAHAMEGDREKCLRAGCDDFATKPIDPATLIETIQQHLARGRDHATLESPEASPVLVSTLTSEIPEVAHLTAQFVAGLSGRVAAIERSLAEGDFEALGTLAHQLKGTAGLYGFPSLMEAAANLEVSANARQSLDDLREQVRVLADLCRRARPPRAATATPKETAA